MAYPTLQEKANVIILDEAAIAEWQDAAKPIVDAAMDGITADNAAAPEALEQLKTMIAGYDPATFKIGTNNFGLEVEW